MKSIGLFFLLLSCSQLQDKFQERPLQENQLIQCYRESDTFRDKKPFTAQLRMLVSEMGTVTEAKILSSTPKDPNLNTCLTYVMLGAGRPLKSKEEPGLKTKELKFTPEGKYEL